MEKELNLFWMYPDMLNLHGDRGNILAFEKVASKLGLKLNVKRIDTYEETIDFNKADILFFNPGEVRIIERIVARLSADIEKLTDYIESKGFAIAIGTSGVTFMKETIRANGEKIEGLGFLDANTIERDLVFGDDIYFTLNDVSDLEVIGQQINMLDISLNNEGLALGKINYGRGNNNEGVEGAKYNNLIFTNSLGPVFVKNPWWAEQILRQAAVRRNIEIQEKDIDYTIEIKSYNSAKKFIQEKSNKKI